MNIDIYARYLLGEEALPSGFVRVLPVGDMLFSEMCRIFTETDHSAEEYAGGDFKEVDDKYYVRVYRPCPACGETDPEYFTNSCERTFTDTFEKAYELWRN